jgi:hypothetical protein
VGVSASSKGGGYIKRACAGGKKWSKVHLHIEFAGDHFCAYY